MNARDLAGKKFGSLTAVSIGDSYTKPCGSVMRRWICRCDCGNTKLVTTNGLNSGNTTSCGCKRPELVSKAHRTHGKSRTPIYNVWWTMIARCKYKSTKQYADYGGRGIRVCDRWQGPKGFENFISDMGDRPSPRHQIDRHPNNNGNYEPGNCRWTTRDNQMKNRRNNVILTARGEAKTLIEWCEQLHLNLRSIRSRINRGWTHEAALFTPAFDRGQKTHR